MVQKSLRSLVIVRLQKIIKHETESRLRKRFNQKERKRREVTGATVRQKKTQL